jgi:preprotein translocase subunit SecD
MAQPTPPPPYAAPPQRGRGLLVLVGALALVLVAVLAVGTVIVVRRVNEPDTPAAVTRLDGGHVIEVQPAQSPDSATWPVNLTFDDEGAKTFGSLTADLATKQTPLNQLAIVVRGQVVAAPTVMSAIPGGKIQIAGTYTKDDAEKLAAQITG